MLDPIHEEKIIVSGAYPHLNNDALKQKLALTQRQEKLANRGLFLTTAVIVLQLIGMTIPEMLSVYEVTRILRTISIGFTYMSAFSVLIFLFFSMRIRFLLNNLQHEALRRGIIEFEV